MKMKQTEILLKILERGKVLIPALIFVSFCLIAEDSIKNNKDEFYQYFKSGQYAEALTVLSQISTDEFTESEKAYLNGICHSKLQEFDKSIASFEEAIAKNNKHADLQYEYGQALYAANRLKAARRAFENSMNENYNKAASLYYIAYISQILEDYKEAKNNYIKLIKFTSHSVVDDVDTAKEKEIETHLKQISRFQLAETLLSASRAGKTNKDEVAKDAAKYVLPLMSQAIETDEKAEIAQEIKQRIYEIQKEFNLDPDQLVNGRRISSKRFYGYVYQKVKSDNNVSFTSEENNVHQTMKSSAFYETEAFARYDFLYDKKIIMTPEFRFNFMKYSNQSDPEVYQNDSYVLNLNLRNKYEHTLNDLPASFLFDIEYWDSHKDWNKIHSRDPYSKSVVLSVGENFNYFSAGETTLKMKLKEFKGTDELINNHTISATGEQILLLANQHLLLVYLGLDLINNYKNPSTSSNSFLARFDYLMMEAIWGYNVDFGLGTTFTDTKEQSTIRGAELTLNPSIDVSKNITERIKFSLNYDYTKNNSKSVDYNYTKSVVSLGLQFSF